jgi:hypothetical protein
MWLAHIDDLKLVASIDSLLQLRGADFGRFARLRLTAAMSYVSRNS